MDEQPSARLSHRLSQRQMEKAPEGVVGNHREQQQEHLSPEHGDRRLPSPRPQQRHAGNHDLPPPLPYGITTPPTASPTAPRFVTKVNSDRLENGAAHGNANKAPPHVGGRHLSPPPHPDTEMEAAAGDGDDDEDDNDDNDDIYTDDVHQDLGDHVRTAEPVAARTETETVPTVGAGEGPALEPFIADIHPRDEQEGYEHGVTDKNRDTLQKEPTRDVYGVEANAASSGGVLASSHGSTE